MELSKSTALGVEKPWTERYLEDPDTSSSLTESEIIFQIQDPLEGLQGLHHEKNNRVQYLINGISLDTPKLE